MSMIHRLAWALFRAVVPAELQDEIEGDMREEHAARAAVDGRGAADRWLLRALLGMASSLAWARNRWAPRSTLRTPALPRRPLRMPVSVTDLRLALRLVARQPVLSATSVAALAVAMCLAITGFSMVNAVLFADLPLPSGDDFVYLRLTDRQTLRQVSTPAPIFEAWQTGSRTLDTVGAFRTRQANLETADGLPVDLRVADITVEGLRATGTAPLLGRLFSTPDAGPGAAPVVLLREDLWRDHLGADREAIGRVVRIGGASFTLIGVMPADFAFPESQSAWFPFDPATGVADMRGLQVFGVLAPEASRAAARSELQALLDARTLPDAVPASLAVLPFTRAFSGQGFAGFMAAAMVLLLLILTVAAANVANLITARTAARAEEIAVRVALGASRAGIVAQLFTEVLVLGAMAATLAVLAAHRLVGWIDRLIADEAPMWIDVRIDPAVVGFAAMLAVFATAVASLAPALRSTAGGVGTALRRGGPGVAGPRFGRLGGALVFSQIALSVALLSGAALLGRGLLGYQAVELGLPETEILTASLYLPPDLDADDGASIRPSLVAELEAAPGIVRAGLAMSLPRNDASRHDMELENAGGTMTANEVRAAYLGPGFFDALGLEPLQGRLLAPADHDNGAPRVVVVNQAFVRAFGAGDGTNATGVLGRRLRHATAPGEEPTDWREIVGVVRDLDLSPGTPGQEPGVYIPVSDSNFYFVAARIEGPVALAAGELRRVVGAHDGRILVRDVQTLDRVGWESRTLLRSVGLGLAALGFMALALSVAGIYAIIAFAVQQRRREIGVRVALGAAPASIRRDILARTGVRLVVGGLVGAALAYLLGAATAVLPIDLPSLAARDLLAVCAAMLGTGLAASWFPARRAARIEPAEALRGD